MEGVFFEPVGGNWESGSRHVHLGNLLGDQAVTLSKQSNTQGLGTGMKAEMERHIWEFWAYKQYSKPGN